MTDITGIDTPGLLAAPPDGPRAAMPVIPMPERFEPPPGVDVSHRFTPMEDQGNSSMCVLFALNELREADDWETNGFQHDHDAQPGYDLSKTIDGIPNTPGTYEWAAIEAMRRLGWLRPKDRAYELHTLAHFQRALQLNLLVMAGYSITEAWSSAMLREHGQIADGEFKRWGLHEVVVLAYSPRMIYIGNSWGRAWGHDGIAPMARRVHERTCIGGVAIDRRRVVA